MDELLISDRIKFNKKGTQSNFILSSKEILDLTWAQFAKRLGINQKTLYSWRMEKLRMSAKAARIIYKLTKLPIPKGHTVIKWNDHLKDISKQGGRAVVIKYSRVSLDEENRKEKWKQWWQDIGKHKKPAQGFQVLRKIKIPKKDEKLSEFVGIMLGDGGINKYHTSVTLSSKEQKYILFVSKMIKKLFGVVPKIYLLKHAKAVKIVSNRKQLVDFCQQIGLVKGNKVKHQVDIPMWIKNNDEFSRACIKGLIDTDGCFYTNSYYSHGKKYSYFKIAFTNASLPLLKSVAEILMSLGIQPRIDKYKKDVRIESNKYVFKYIKDVGSHNDKHLQKIRKWGNSKNMLK